MTSPREATYGVWLHERCVGKLHQRGDYTWFEFTEEYRVDPHRPVLGLRFEDNLLKRRAAHMRLPAWFSNLLPEGKLREWVADDRGVSSDREMELLAQVGHDLPGAVRVLAEDTIPGETPVEDAKPANTTSGDHARWRFSLAGVGLKFSMLERGDRLTLPAFGEGGDWIVKLPDWVYSDVPRNEFAMMSLAREVGIDVPEIKLVPRDDVTGLPTNVWAPHEQWAYAIRRFDRDESRNLVHIEDFAQVRGFYPGSIDKYQGSYETLASLVYRRRDLTALREFARRLAFCILISNGDAHLKNWSLIYRDSRIPTLSPAYDFVSTGVYRDAGDPETLGLRFHRTNRFNQITLDSFDRLESKLAAREAGLADVVAEVVHRTRENWPKVAETLADAAYLADFVSSSIETHSRTLLRRAQ